MSGKAEQPKTTAPRPLVALRALIDSVDHEILNLLARRHAIVGEIAEFKRDHRIPIRDLAREREILADRQERSERLGISAGVVESMFRLILAASRDRQSELKAEVPTDIEARRVAIIGGQGGMGRCMARIFSDLGHEVNIADLDTELTPEAAARDADVVVISVPIDATVDVIRGIGPLVREDALLMDVTSIKAGPVEAMLASTCASVVGTHPLFGPSVHTVQGQRIVLTPARGDVWAAWVRQNLSARGLTVCEATPQEHDQAMAIVQVLTHFSTEVMGRTLTKLDASIERTLQFTSPVYLMELIMTARHFAQSADLYASIQMSNPQTPEVTRAFVAAAEELRAVVVGGDATAFRRLFEEAQQHLGAFRDQALDQSSYLIDRLVERA